MNRVWWPNTLSWQMVLILFSGVTLALVSSAGIHLHDRRQALFAFGEMQTAQRVATIVQLLDAGSAGERGKIASVVRTPLQYLRFLHDEHPFPERAPRTSQEAHVHDLLKHHLGERRPLRVAVLGLPEEGEPLSGAAMPMMGMHRMAMPMPHHHHAHMVMMNRIFPQGISFLAQVRLSDGTWAEFHNHLPKEAFTWPKHLLYSLAILLLVVTALSLIAVRLTTRPLSLLADAAQALGRDINRPPLSVSGPREVQHAARAFNTMQARIVRHVQERTHLLAAISHDLKTPLTRMRLQVERLNDEPVRSAILESLAEMENMTGDAMDYIQGMEGVEAVRRVDIVSMLENLQELFQEMGGTVILQSDALPPFPVMQKSLKRCLTNLTANAVAYGGQARIRADVLGERLRISIADAGPGIPEAEMERVFQPFVRLEKSRNRHTGGTGLGLSIARNIARAHGGELTLRNRPEGGLEVILSLPKQPESR